MSVTIVGKTSYLAQELSKLPATDGWCFLSHGEALDDLSWRDNTQTVINFAFCPDFKTSDYDPDKDIDKKLATAIAMHDVHYVMLSSRAVYGEDEDNFVFDETRPPNPQAPYAVAKVEVEKELNAILPEERLTILRPSNIFGFEYGRPTFFGMALTRLKNENKIVFDMARETQRDFLSVWRFCEAIIQIANMPLAGTYNLGSGTGTQCGDIADWLIEGYGQGSLEITNDRKHGEFVLDMLQANETYGLPCITKEMIREDCLKCGAYLKTA